LNWLTLLKKTEEKPLHFRDMSEAARLTKLAVFLSKVSASPLFLLRVALS
jgi:hypothetical protein